MLAKTCSAHVTKRIAMIEMPAAPTPNPAKTKYALIGKLAVDVTVNSECDSPRARWVSVPASDATAIGANARGT